MITLKKLSVLAVLSLMVTACSQYEEGPAVSLYSKGKRVQGTWYFDQVMYNDVDSSEHYYKGRIEFSLGEGAEKDWGLYVWHQDPYNPDPSKMILGGWEFLADKDSIQMIVMHTDPQLWDTVSWKINRLAYSEWWMERQLNDTTQLTWRLWKWVF